MHSITLTQGTPIGILLTIASFLLFCIALSVITMLGITLYSYILHRRNIANNQAEMREDYDNAPACLEAVLVNPVIAKDFLLSGQWAKNKELRVLLNDGSLSCIARNNEEVVQALYRLMAAGMDISGVIFQALSLRIPLSLPSDLCTQAIVGQFNWRSHNR